MSGQKDEPLLDTRPTMTPGELAALGVRVPGASGEGARETPVRVRVEFTATRSAVDRVLAYVASQGAADRRRRFLRLDGGEL